MKNLNPAVNFKALSRIESLETKYDNLIIEIQSQRQKYSNASSPLQRSPRQTSGPDSQIATKASDQQEDATQKEINSFTNRVINQIENNQNIKAKIDNKI